MEFPQETETDLPYHPEIGLLSLHPKEMKLLYQ